MYCRFCTEYLLGWEVLRVLATPNLNPLLAHADMKIYTYNTVKWSHMHDFEFNFS